MTSRFRQELTTVPTVRIKVSRQGVATTINWVVNSNGQRSLKQIGDPRLSGPLPTDNFLIPGTRKDFGTGNVADMTSPGLNSFKDLLAATRSREREIKAEIKKAKWQLGLSQTVRALGWISLMSVVAKPIRERAHQGVIARRTEVATLGSNLAATRISVNFDMDSEVAGPHREMQAAFDRMRCSHSTWSIQTEQRIDRVKARSWASTVVSRGPTHLQRVAASLVDTNDLPLAMSVLRGKSTAYFYPGFVLVDSTHISDFALIDMAELGITYEATNFTESESVPRDAKMIGKTWAKANKNGSRDRRFKHNRELPIMRYGCLQLDSIGGMNEAFMFSDADASANFAKAANILKRILAMGRSNHRIEDQPRLSRH